jgi:predicted lactoylglutathione lyase
MDRPVLGLVSVVVQDVGASATFYERLGVDLGPPPPAPWDALHRGAPESEAGAQLDLDAASFAPRWNQGWAEGRTGVVINFRVQGREDVDRLHDELVAAGAPSQQPPHDAFWGSRYAIVEDPAGNAVGIMSPRDEAFASAPPEV